MGGEHDAVRRRTDLVPGPPDPLQRARHRRRRPHLHHEVDRAHVDAELERAGGDHRRQRPGLELGLDAGPLLAAHRAVVGAREDGAAAVRADSRRRTGRARRPRRSVARSARPAPGRSRRDLVDPRGEPLSAAPRVGEHDRRAVRGDQVDHALLDVGPDRRPRRWPGRPRRTGRGRRREPVPGQVGEVRDRARRRRRELLARRRLHDLTAGRRRTAAGHRRGTPRRSRPGARSPTARPAVRVRSRSSSASRRSSESASARRAWCRRARGSRRRSPSRRPPARPAPPRSA